MRLPSVVRLVCSSSLPGNLQAHIATNTIKPPLHSTALGLPVVNHSTATLELIVTNIKYLNLVGKMRLLAQPLRNGPNSLWFIIQLCIRSLDLAKQYAAPTAGVLHGSPGKYIPINATANKIQPKLNHSAFLIDIFKYLF